MKEFALLRKGIVEGDWSKVCEAYKIMTEEELPVPQQTEGLTKEAFAQKLIELGQSLLGLPQESEVLNEVRQQQSDAPPGTHWVPAHITQVKPLSDDNEPADPSKMYPVKNTGSRPPSRLMLNCEECGQVFQLEQEAFNFMKQYSGKVTCDQCNEKHRSLSRQ